MVTSIVVEISFKYSFLNNILKADRKPYMQKKQVAAPRSHCLNLLTSESLTIF
jgi:hypothetical protein